MNLPNRLAQKISSELNYDEEKSAVISYGIFAFLQILASLALVALLGVVLGVAIQALTVSFVSSILRQYSGGAHATKPSICLIVGTAATIAITLIAHYAAKFMPIEYLICTDVFVIAFSYYLVAKYAPVDSPAKPIKTEKKRKKMKRRSLIVLSMYVVFISILTIMYFAEKNILYIEYAMCIGMAIGWQVFSFTKKGHRFVNKIDSKLNKITFKKGDLS